MATALGDRSRRLRESQRGRIFSRAFISWHTKEINPSPFPSPFSQRMSKDSVRDMQSFGVHQLIFAILDAVHLEFMLVDNVVPHFSWLKTGRIRLIQQQLPAQKNMAFSHYPDVSSGPAGNTNLLKEMQFLT